MKRIEIWQLYKIKDVIELVENIKYALDGGKKPRIFYPKVYEFVKSYLSKYTLDDLLRELSLTMADDNFKELLSDINLEDFAVFPADVAPWVLYLTGAKAHPYSLTPFHELLQRAGRVEKKDKCVIVSIPSTGVNLPQKIKLKANTYRSRLLKSCNEIILIGGVRDEKHIFRMPMKVKLAKSAGKRSDGSFLYLVWYSKDGKIEPLKVPAMLTGGVLAALSQVWQPLSKQFEIVRYLPVLSRKVKGYVIKLSSIKNGKVEGILDEKICNEKSVVKKGDLVVAIRGKEFKAAVVDREGIFCVDPNVIGVKVRNFKKAKALYKYITFLPIKEALQSQICLRTTPPFLSDSLIISLPVPENVEKITEEISKFEEEYFEAIKKAKEKLKKDFIEFLKLPIRTPESQ